MNWLNSTKGGEKTETRNIGQNLKKISITDQSLKNTDSKSHSSSCKWLTIKDSKLHIDSSSQSVFNHVGGDCFNLISIFGAARQGKSFIMNCLADQIGLFRISNQRESCTQGIDISPHTMNIKSFSTIDSGKVVETSRNSKNIQVGLRLITMRKNKD